MKEGATNILTLNVGSSSIKATLYAVNVSVSQGADPEFSGVDLGADLPGGQPGLGMLFGSLESRLQGKRLDAIGHRVVHGGSRYTEPQKVTPEVTGAIEALARIDPEHAPLALAGIRSATAAFPMSTQVACFDTAFHRTMPQVAQLYSLPKYLRDKGIARYGFHGLSYEYIVGALRKEYLDGLPRRIIIAHLGSGASMAAVRDGVGIETTMGFTPTGGLVMSTRTGDLDPGVLLFLLETENMGAPDIGKLVNKQSGLLGISETTADMRELLAAEAGDPRAAQAVELFCYHAKKHIGALAATLDGLDMLVFTAGIGEHSAPIRERICAGLGFLGIRLDAARNGAHAPVISGEESRVTVRVIKTDENLMIAKHVYELVKT